MPDEVAHEAERLTRKPRRWSKAASRATSWAGSGWAASVMLVATIGWLVAGFLSDFSRAWELAMTVGTPILTLVLLVVIQHTQNHDNQAVQLKLDELIRSIEQSSNAMIRVEEASADDLQRLTSHFREQATGHADR